MTGAPCTGYVCRVYRLPTSRLFPAFDDEKLNKRAGARMKDETFITLVCNRSHRRADQAADAVLLALEAAGSGGDSPRGNADAGFRPIGSVLSVVCRAQYAGA